MLKSRGFRFSFPVNLILMQAKQVMQNNQISCYNLNQIIMLYLKIKIHKKFSSLIYQNFSYIHPEIKSYITKKKTQLQDPINYNNAISVTSFIPRSIYGYHNLTSTNISNENMNAILYIP